MSFPACLSLYVPSRIVGDIMRIAFCHNFYQQPGGEDQVFRDESAMMEEHGHEVLRFTKHNDEINRTSKLSLVKKTFWNKAVYNELLQSFAEFKPDVVHFTNTFPLISPAAYKAARKSNAVVVQSLHNFRMICPGSLLLRNGSNCETCIKMTLALPSIYRKCYRDSFFASAVTAGMNAWHKVFGTSRKYVNRFISLTNFTKQKFVEGGFDPNRISVKQNFVAEVPEESIDSKNGRALFVGRLAKEKGIDVLIDAWKKLDIDIPLDIVGDGPLAEFVQNEIGGLPNIRFHGRIENAKAKEMMAKATVQIVPSNYYETFGLVVIEAFAVGTPAIVTDHGSLAELVVSGQTGFKFQPGNSQDLADKVKQLYSDEKARESMGQNAREEFARKYTRSRNYEILEQIYRQTLEEHTLKEAKN